MKSTNKSFTTQRFTNKQLKNFLRYEQVRLSGAYNMFDRRARELTGMDKDDYFFCIENYVELRNYGTGENV